MMTSTNETATVGEVLALSFLVVALLAALLSTASADAATTSVRAFAWGDNYDGQLGNAHTARALTGAPQGA